MSHSDNSFVSDSTKPSDEQSTNDDLESSLASASMDSQDSGSAGSDDDIDSSGSSDGSDDLSSVSSVWEESPKSCQADGYTGPGTCSSNGICNSFERVCICFDGFYGENCQYLCPGGEGALQCSGNGGRILYCVFVVNLCMSNYPSRMNGLYLAEVSYFAYIFVFIVFPQYVWMELMAMDDASASTVSMDKIALGYVPEAAVAMPVTEMAYAMTELSEMVHVIALKVSLE